MTGDLLLTLLNVVFGLILTGVGIEMVNSPPDKPWKKWVYRSIFLACGIAIVVTTAALSVRSTNEQQRAKDEAAKTERELSDKLSKSDGKLDAISHFEQQFLDFVSKNRGGGNDVKAYQAISGAILRLAQHPAREIQDKLSLFLKEENKVMQDWRDAMGQPDNKNLQSSFASKAQQKHVEIKKYLQTIPRGSFYSESFDSYPKNVCAGYPLGHSDETCRDLETLDADIKALRELMKDPNLGEP